MDNLIKALHKDRNIILNFCKKFKEIYLYGAGAIGEYFYNYLLKETINYVYYYREFDILFL